MEYLFSNRRDYFNRDRSIPECAFCDALAKPDSFDNLIIYRGTENFVILNKYPYTSGHMMVVPNLHTSHVEDLNEAALTEMMLLSRRAIETLNHMYHPQGFNMGLNIGAAGGAGIAEHLHMHVVPRWSRDTNFITVLGNARVLPESLQESYQQIKSAWFE
jgi:ATP adenylyltransferase